MSIAEIAEYCNVSRSNARKMLEHHGVKPRSELLIGPVYDSTKVKRMQERRLADEEARRSDELRREAALRKGDGRE